MGSLSYLPSSLAQQCVNCPTGCSSCYYSNGFVTIVKANTGYSIDSVNGLCYPSCKSSEYYDYGVR